MSLGASSEQLASDASVRPPAIVHIQADTDSPLSLIFDSVIPFNFFILGLRPP